MSYRYQGRRGRRFVPSHKPSRSTHFQGRSGMDDLTTTMGAINLNKSPNSIGSDPNGQSPLQRDLDALFEKQAREKLHSVPLYDLPMKLFRPGLTLYDHQKEGIRWLVHQERSGGAEGLFSRTTNVMGETIWECKISGDTTKIEPKRAKGAILADGK